MKLRYTLSSAASALDISLRKVEQLIADGALVCHQDAPHGVRYISHQALEAYIEEREGVPVVGRLSRRRT